MTDQHLEDLIVHIVTPLVDHPDDIRVIREETDQKIALRLSVHKSDTVKLSESKADCKSDSNSCICSWRTVF